MDASYYNRHFKHAFQPVVCLNTMEIHHHEALLRSDSEDIFLPGENIGGFIGGLEREGRIAGLDLWTLYAVSKKIQSGIISQPVAVNCSGLSAGSDAFFVFARNILEKTGSSGLINFEITETARIKNISNVRRFVAMAKSHGAHTSIDDYGVGFSQDYAIDSLGARLVKIDGSFVRKMHESKDARAFIQGTVERASSHGILVVAECIETSRDAKILRALGVQLGQGYYFSPPLDNILSTADLKSIMRERHVAARSASASLG